MKKLLSRKGRSATFRVPPHHSDSSVHVADDALAVRRSSAVDEDGRSRTVSRLSSSPSVVSCSSKRTGIPPAGESCSCCRKSCPVVTRLRKQLQNLREEKTQIEELVRMQTATLHLVEEDGRESKKAVGERLQLQQRLASVLEDEKKSTEERLAAALKTAAQLDEELGFAHEENATLCKRLEEQKKEAEAAAAHAAELEEKLSEEVAKVAEEQRLLQVVIGEKASNGEIFTQLEEERTKLEAEKEEWRKEQEKWEKEKEEWSKEKEREWQEEKTEERKWLKEEKEAWEREWEEEWRNAREEEWKKEKEEEWRKEKEEKWETEKEKWREENEKVWKEKEAWKKKEREAVWRVEREEEWEKEKSQWRNEREAEWVKEKEALQEKCGVLEARCEELKKEAEQAQTTAARIAAEQQQKHWEDQQRRKELELKKELEMQQQAWMAEQLRDREQWETQRLAELLKFHHEEEQQQDMPRKKGQASQSKEEKQLPDEVSQQQVKELLETVEKLQIEKTAVEKERDSLVQRLRTAEMANVITEEVGQLPLKAEERRNLQKQGKINKLHQAENAEQEALSKLSALQPEQNEGERQESVEKTEETTLQQAVVKKPSRATEAHLQKSIGTLIRRHSGALVKLQEQDKEYHAQQQRLSVLERQLYEREEEIAERDKAIAVVEKENVALLDKIAKITGDLGQMQQELLILRNQRDESENALKTALKTNAAAAENAERDRQKLSQQADELEKLQKLLNQEHIPHTDKQEEDAPKTPRLGLFTRSGTILHKSKKNTKESASRDNKERGSVELNMAALLQTNASLVAKYAEAEEQNVRERLKVVQLQEEVKSLSMTAKNSAAEMEVLLCAKKQLTNALQQKDSEIHFFRKELKTAREDLAKIMIQRNSQETQNIEANSTAAVAASNGGKSPAMLYAESEKISSSEAARTTAVEKTVANLQLQLDEARVLLAAERERRIAQHWRLRKELAQERALREEKAETLCEQQEHAVGNTHNGFVEGILLKQRGKQAVQNFQKKAAAAPGVVVSSKPEHNSDSGIAQEKQRHHQREQQNGEEGKKEGGIAKIPQFEYVYRNDDSTVSDGGNVKTLIRLTSKEYPFVADPCASSLSVLHYHDLD